MSIFDQSTSVDAEHHILNIREEDFPEKYHLLIRRLQAAVLKPELRKKMEMEDSILLNIEDIQRDLIEKLAKAEQKANKAEQKATESEQKATEAKQAASEAKLENEELRKRLAEFERADNT